MRWKHVHGIILFILVFFLVDLAIAVLALFGYNGFFVTVVREAGTISVHGSDALVFILSVPIALVLHVLWYRGRWSWFSTSPKIHRNVFYVFLVLYLVLFFALIYAGAHACHSACSVSRVSSCTVNYRPFGVNVVYACKIPKLVNP